MRILSAIFLSAVLIAPQIAPAAEKWDAQWKKVDEAVQQGLPKTAIEKSAADPRRGDLPKRTTPWPSRPSAARSPWKAPSRATSRKKRSSAWMPRSPRPPPRCSPCWRSSRPTGTGSISSTTAGGSCSARRPRPHPGKDFTTWDLPRLFAEIGKHFQKALAAEEQLKKIPVQTFGDLLDKGTMPDSYRPTLYDFVAHQALEFYNSGEQAAAKSEDAFELSADSPIFRPAEEFVAWKIESERQRFHHAQGHPPLPAIASLPSNDDDKSALLDADIERLSFGNNKAVGEEKAGLYKAALKRFVKQWGDHPISAIARFRWAEVLQQEGCAGRGPRSGPAGGPGLCQHARRQPLLQPREADRGQVGQHHDGTGLERAVALDPRHLSQLDEGLFPPRPRGLAGPNQERSVPRRMARRRPAESRSWPRNPISPGRPTCRRRKTTRSGSRTFPRRKS